jgi:hypothetical protein
MTDIEPQGPPAPPHDLELGHGVALHCAMDSLDEVDVRITFRDHTIFKQHFRDDHDPHTVKLDLPFVRADFGIWMDAFEGELVAAGSLAVNPPGDQGKPGRDDDWQTVFDSDRKVLMEFDPAIGEIGGDPAVFEAVVENDRYGRSQLCTPAVLRLHVDPGKRLISDAGRLVNDHLFGDHPPFVFNTVACVGRCGEDGSGLYTDPNSHWFNVFFGQYQIDAPKPDWSRPFGYKTADGAASEAEFDDLARLGKADWNYFSNWMYGVPLEAIKPYGDVDLESMGTQQTGPNLIGETLWHHIVLDGMECVSTYESKHPAALKLVRNTIIDDVWRRSFGLPTPSENHDESFIPTRLRAQVDMAYWEDDDAFHTIIFGGTAPAPTDNMFLVDQLAATRKLIEGPYAKRGFPTTGG